MQREHHRVEHLGTDFAVNTIVFVEAYLFLVFEHLFQKPLNLILLELPLVVVFVPCIVHSLHGRLGGGRVAAVLPEGREV